MNARVRKAGGSKSIRGFSLVMGLLFLLVLALLALAMFRSFGLQELIAGNTQDKQRSLAVAKSALQYGEWWLLKSKGGPGTPCSGVIDLTVGGAMTVCSNELTNASSLPWADRIDLQLPGMAVLAGGGLDSTSLDINYQAKPGVYINFLGTTADGLRQLYQVTAFGYGGNAATASVVRSTYQLTTDVKDLGAP